MGIAHARSGRWDAVRSAIAGLRVLVRPMPPPLPPTPGEVCTAILEAASAQGTGRPEAGRLISAVDSVLKTVPYLALTWENLMVAKLLEGEQEYRRAAAAATRYRHALGYPSYLSSYLREAGRLFALAGDRESAVRHYQDYLALRGNSEMSEESEAIQVRRALAELGK